MGFHGGLDVLVTLPGMELVGADEVKRGSGEDLRGDTRSYNGRKCMGKSRPCKKN